MQNVYIRGIRLVGRALYSLAIPVNGRLYEMAVGPKEVFFTEVLDAHAPCMPPLPAVCMSPKATLSA